MPNHCSNDFFVRGTYKKIREFVAHMETSKDELFDFNTIIPYPWHFKSLDEQVRKMQKEYDLAYKEGRTPPYSTIPKDGFNSGGYEWCISNWGTKWNAYSTTREWCPSDYTQDDDDACVYYSFQTAWRPPIPVFNHMAKMFSDLKFEHHAFEQGSAYMCVNHWESGRPTIKFECPYHGPRGG